MQAFVPEPSKPTDGPPLIPAMMSRDGLPVRVDNFQGDVVIKIYESDARAQDMMAYPALMLDPDVAHRMGDQLKEAARQARDN